MMIALCKLTVGIVVIGMFGLAGCGDDGVQDAPQGAASNAGTAGPPVISASGSEEFYKEMKAGMSKGGNEPRPARGREPEADAPKK
jgi:hypothetical protein